MMTDLITKSSEEIMTTLYKPTVFVVDGLFAQGLYLLAGSPKVGKSWLALKLCLAVTKGEKLFDRKTLQGSALYFCLEDSYQRIQNRLYELTDDPSDKLFFALKADTLGSGLEEQIALFKSEHPDLCLVVIDTLQMVRNETESSYGSDYADLLPLKGLAQQLGITMILVHHLRKAFDSDPFNMISGSNGLSGCSDGQLVLRKENDEVPSCDDIDNDLKTILAVHVLRKVSDEKTCTHGELEQYKNEVKSMGEYAHMKTFEDDEKIYSDAVEGNEGRLYDTLMKQRKIMQDKDEYIVKDDVLDKSLEDPLMNDSFDNTFI